ncbi:MAG: dihydroorotate dehydrogenase electron transfer subunit [Clostridia bacterium]
MSDRTREIAKIIDNDRLAHGYYLMRLASPVIAARAKPGQFVHIKLPENNAIYLRRPISICRADAAAGTIELFYKTVGNGTEMLSELTSEQTLDMMGPIGTAFPLETGKRPLLIAGGMGIAPLIMLVERINRDLCSPTVYYGAHTANELFFITDIGRYAELHCVCDDEAGDVVSALPKVASNFSSVFACGPIPMLRAVQKWAAAHNVRGFVSLEERLACGIGACSGCAFPMRVGLRRTYKKVCVDGPVFPLEEVIFDE